MFSPVIRNGTARVMTADASAYVLRCDFEA